MSAHAPLDRRLLLLSTEFPPGPGGIGAHACQLARGLTRLGWEVQVVSPQAYVDASARDAFNRRQDFAIRPLDERSAGPVWWAGRIKDVVGAIRAARPDILVATGGRALWLAAALSPALGLPWLAVGHGSEFLEDSRLRGRPTRWAVERATAVVAVSRYTAQLIEGIARPRRLVVIPNAADGERFRPGLDVAPLRRSLGLDGRRVLLTVGRVSERKAQDVVIRALPLIRERFPDVVYVVAGLPERQAAYRALAEQLGVAQSVIFTGVVADEELPAYFNLCDLFVLVSRRADGDVEGYGIVVQEAALCGKPAVVSRDCGLTEAIVEGVTGLSVPPDDPAATAEAVIALLQNETAQQMGRRAREHAQRATWVQRIAEYDQLLQSILSVSTDTPVEREAI